MLKQSICMIIILLIIACVSIRADDGATDSRIYKVDWMVKKEFKLIFDEVSWSEANKFCTDSGMQLASIESYEEYQQIENLIKDKHMVDDPFWISQSITAIEENSEMAESKPRLSTLDSSNRCISWYWTNGEHCCALWPLANEWSHEDCSEEKYFICQQTHKSETVVLEVIQRELLTLIDEAMFTEFAVALSSTTQITWFSLVEGALQTWLVQQHQISKHTTLLEEQVDLIAADLARSKKNFNAEELRRFVESKFERIESEHRVELLSERFRQFIGDLYVALDPTSNQLESPSDDDIAALVKKVLMLVRVQGIKSASEMSKRRATAVLDENFVKTIAKKLLKFREDEFKLYVNDVFAQLEVYGEDKADMSTFFQLYLLVKDELFSLISKSVIKTTSRERKEITSYVLGRILDEKQLIDADSVFGQIFVIIATGTTVLIEEKSVQVLDDETLRSFVKKEFDGLQPDDLLKLKFEGYVKIVMDELVKLTGKLDIVKNESGEILLANVVDLIATQFLLYAEEEMKTLADRMTTSIEKELKNVQEIVEQTKTSLSSVYDESTISRLAELIEEELGAIIIETLFNFSDKYRMELAADGLSKILAKDRPIGRLSIFVRALVNLGYKLSEIAEDNLGFVSDDELKELVQSELENGNYAKNIQLFEEAYMYFIAQDFIELIKDEVVMSFAHDEDEDIFGEFVTLIARKLYETAMN